MECRKVREIADSFLGDELLVETNHDIIRHLETCAACRFELEARKNLRERLREACLNAPEAQASTEFVEHLQVKLQAAAARKGSSFSKFKKGVMLPALAACIIFAGTREASAAHPPYFECV